MQSRLRVGLDIEYVDPLTNPAHADKVLEFRRKQAVVLDAATDKRWLIAYVAIDLDSADVEIREKPAQRLGRNEVAGRLQPAPSDARFQCG